MAKTISITSARKDIYKIAQEVNEVHEEVHVYNASTGNNMVMISESDWNSIQETLYLYSIPGMVESILAGRDEPLEGRKVYDPNEEW